MSFNDEIRSIAIEEFVARHREKYREDIRPHILDGHYELAHLAMRSYNLGFLSRRDEIAAGVHYGATMVAQTVILQEALGAGKREEIEKAMKWFEIFAGQTKLPSR